VIEEFSFKIKKLFVSDGYMLVDYHAPGYSAVEVGVPLPNKDQSDEDVIRAYAPYTAWELQDSQKIERRVPKVGTHGVIRIETET
jgi:hypothetical protein